MKKIDIEELRSVQLEILQVVADFCEKNGITYWIDSGTLLGAIRHKGYIPWDDDIDVGMMRDDYNRFFELFNQQNDRYKFVCIENTPDFFAPHGKVCDTTTELYEPDEQGYKTSINIDIFVYDNAPDDDRELKKMYDKRDFLRSLYVLRTGTKVVSTNAFKKWLKCILKAFLRMFKVNNQIHLMAKNSQKYSTIQTKRVGNFTAYTRMVCDKRVFDGFIDVEFEGKQYKAPVGYDEWLRSFYGDYMKLPPVEKRVSHHTFVAYTKTNDEGD